MATIYKPYSELMTELQRLCTKKSSGTLYIATDENLLLQIGLDGGAIVFLQYRNKHTADVLPMIREISAGTVRFLEGPVFPTQVSLPPTGEILSFLVSGDTKELELLDLPDETVEALQQLLAAFIGPMASIVCREHIGRARDVRSLIDSLADTLPDSQQEQFRRTATEIMPR